MIPPPPLAPRLSDALCRLLPPPQVLAAPLRLVPRGLQGTLLEAAMRRVLGQAVADGSLDPLTGRRLGIEVDDLGLRWIVALEAGRLRVCPPGTVAESTVSGSSTDLLLLASRLEDADTLFFQRRLRLTGDTDLGLTARNLLDQLPWDSIPAGLRVALVGCARVARRIQDAQRRAPP